ncbi:MAG TPA: CHRD domain-containing protein [Blastocatellia bacterium]|nr:CHRD domain-containing protein [Blastocatellia bacterium]
MKKSIASVALMTLTVIAVASMMMRSARSESIVFTAQMFASLEVAPVVVAGPDVNAFGNVQVVLDTTANTASFVWSVNNVGAPSIILSHIHEGASGVNGPVRIDSGISPASPIPVVNGAASFSKAGIVASAAQIQAIIANPGGFYFNVHSSLSPGGVCRGQLVRQSATIGGGAPTLSEWGAILMGLLIVAACVFFMVGRTKASEALAGALPAQTLARPAKEIDWRLLAKVTLYLEAAIALALVALKAGPTDVLGALTSGVLVAFIAHVLIGAARRH